MASCDASDYDSDGYDTEALEVEDMTLENGYGYDGSSSDESAGSADELLENDEHEGTETATEAIERSPEVTRDPDETKGPEEKKEVRGLTRMLKLTKDWDGKRHVVEFDKFGRFTGKYASEIASFMGVLVRRDVGLRYLKWKKVSPELKEKLWEQILRFYEIEETMKKKMISHLGVHLRNFRRKLYARFIQPNSDKPAKLKKVPQKYRVYLKQEHWDAFITFRLSKECEKLSADRVKARANHKYEHRMGRRGYSGLVEKLKKDKVIREDDDNPSRSLLWRKARQNSDGTYSDDDVKEKAKQLEEFDKKLEDGTLSKEPGVDSVTHVFGKERPGRVRCAGKGVTPTMYYHMPRRVSKESVAELKKQFENERLENQREKEKKDQQMKDVMEKVAEQNKMMAEQKKTVDKLLSKLNSQGLLKKKGAI